MKKISRERAERLEQAAEFLRKKGITAGSSRYSARHSNLRKLDCATRIANGQRPLSCKA